MVVSESVGRVHPSLPILDALIRNLTDDVREAQTVDDALRLRSQIAGLLEKLDVAEHLALSRADALCGR